MWDCCREPLSRDERRVLLDEMLDSCAPPPPPSSPSLPPLVEEVERRRRRLLQSAHQVEEYYDNVSVGYRYAHALRAPSREGAARQLG